MQTKELPERAPLPSCADAAQDDSCDVQLCEVARLEIPALGAWLVPKRDELVSGKYRVAEALGAGGMGAVLRATNVVSGRQVALKWLLPCSSHASVRFVREARAAARIDHPNVVDVYDLGTHAGGHYLVMELLHGRTLGERIEERKLTPHELLEIMIPTLRGLAAVHAQGVIHRDLKPDNVFLCEAPDGSPREPKVLDFGVSKIRADLDPGQTLTRPGAALGTLPYMAPELLEDAPDADERADIYAAGVMMYEALSGKRPFRAGSDGALVRAILAHQPLPLRAREPGVPAQLERVVMRAMAKQPSDRQRDAETLIRELQACAEARAGAAQLHASKSSRRGPSIALALAAASIVIAALLQLGQFGERRTRTEHVLFSRAPARVELARTPRAEAPQASCVAGAAEQGACQPVSEQHVSLAERARPSARPAAPSRRGAMSSARAAPGRLPQAHVRARAGRIGVDEL
jgi:serine/threonine protein kinase